MSAKNGSGSHVRMAGKSSVEAALELLRSRSSNKRKRDDNEKEEKVNKVAQHCTANLVDINEKTNVALSFSENYAITEMRSCLARQDWPRLRELFPLILGCYGDLEPVVWRYAFTILLCSPDSDSSHLRNFLETGLGAQSVEDSHLLEQLLTLQDRST